MYILNQHLDKHDHNQVAYLVLLGHSLLKAMQAYLICHKQTQQAANLLHFNTIVTHRFSDHIRCIMRANQAKVMKIFAIAKKLDILRNSDDEFELARLVSELMVKDHAAVNRRTS